MSHEIAGSGSAVESAAASTNSSPASTLSPYRQRFSQSTRREAWEQRTKKAPANQEQVSLQPRLSTRYDDEKPSSATTNTSLSSSFAPTDEIDDPPTCQQMRPQHMEEIHYYRVVYRGVVALVRKPDSKSAKTGAYVSYGEIIASRLELDVEELESVVSYSSPPPVRKIEELCSPDSPPRSVLSNHTGSVSSLDTLRTASSTGASKIMYNVAPHRQRVTKKAIRVDRVLTGGYAMDASEITVEPQLTTPKRSNVLPLICSSPLPLPDSPIDFFDENNQELGYILSTKNNAMLIEKIRKLPVIQSGKFMYQIVSSAPLQIFTGPCADAPRTKAVLLPGTIHEVCLRLTSDENITYLRLSHRRGWIPDRKVSMNGGALKIGLTPAVKEYVPVDDSISMTSGATPSSLMRRRHRPPRRKQDPNRGRTFESDVCSSKQKTTVGDRTVSPVRDHTTSSNVSVLSDGDFSGTIATPDRSLVKSRPVQTPVELQQSFFLIRVTAPRGLKMLDALQFQVSNLVHGGHSKATQHSGQPTSIFSTMAVPHTTKSTQKVGNPAIFDSVKKQRILPKGAIFEASRRMEKSTSFSQGIGLIKLSDNSGWAIIPSPEELYVQYHNYHAGAANIKEAEATQAFEEIGNSMIRTADESDCIWVRVVARQGVTVECPPPVVSALNASTISPTSSAGGSSSTGASNYGMLTSHDSDVASSVGSAFLDAMFRTPKKSEKFADQGKDGSNTIQHPFYATELSNPHAHATLCCGTYFQINKWDDIERPNLLSKSTQVGHTFRACFAKDYLANYLSQDYVRLRGGRGWVPRSVLGKPAIERIVPPETRFGSFWFRVLAPRGIKVRLGPSRKAASIKSDNDVYFRFECGEFLRACEVVTFFPDKSSPECFAKLYRNRHVQLHNLLSEFRNLQSLTAPAEWVQVLAEDYMYMEECASDPHIQRHRGGWRYNVVCEAGIPVRNGPSFAADANGKVLLAGESVLVTERVTPPGERINWLRIKDGSGWVHDIGANDEVVMIAHSLRDRTVGLTRPHKAERQEKEEIAYNTMIARLFPGSEEERRKG